MKKALVVLLVLTCLSAVAFAQMAALTALTVGGEVTYGMIYSSSSQFTDGWPNGHIGLTATVDKNNSAVMDFSWWNTAPTFANLPSYSTGKPMYTPDLELAYIKSDIGGALNLGSTVDPVLYAGLGVFDLPGYDMTQFGSERLAALGIDAGNADGEMGAEAGSQYGLVALDTNVMSMVHIVLAAGGDAFQTSGGQALIGTYGTVGPLSFEAGWTPRESKSGYVPVGVQYATTFGDIALTAMANAAFNLNSSSSLQGNKSNYSAGAKVVYQGNYTLDAAIITFQSKVSGDTTEKLTGDLMANLTPTFGVVASPYFNFDPKAKDAFDTFEVFAWTTFGATKVRVGYLYTVNDITDLQAGNDYAPSNNGHKGGIWVTVDYNF